MIEIKNVSKSFKSGKSDVHAVRDVSLTIRDGEMFGIIGFLGAGKSTLALDPQTTKQILNLLKNLNVSLGITVVVITHEMAVVKEICNRVAVMDHRRVIEEGEPFSVFAS